MEIYKLVFNPIEVNTYILADASGDCAIIDCGCYDRDEFNELTNLIETEKTKAGPFAEHTLPSRSYFRRYFYDGKIWPWSILPQR